MARPLGLSGTELMTSFEQILARKDADNCSALAVNDGYAANARLNDQVGHDAARAFGEGNGF